MNENKKSRGKGGGVFWSWNCSKMMIHMFKVLLNKERRVKRGWQGVKRGWMQGGWGLHREAAALLRLEVHGGPKQDGKLPSRAGGAGVNQRGKRGGAGGLRVPSRPFEAGQISNTALAPSLAWNPHFCHRLATTGPLQPVIPLNLTLTNTAPKKTPKKTPNHHLPSVPVPHEKQSLWLQAIENSCDSIFYFMIKLNVPLMWVNGFWIIYSGGTQKHFVIYLHITLVCVDPVEECLWSHPLHRETTLRTDTHTHTHTHSGERSNKMYPLKDCRALNFLLHQQEIQIPHDQEISLLLEKLICGSSQGNKALEERLSWGEWISLRNVYIVRAIELINRVTDKEESITVALKHLPGS